MRAKEGWKHQTDSRKISSLKGVYVFEGHSFILSTDICSFLLFSRRCAVFQGFRDERGTAPYLKRLEVESLGWIDGWVDDDL